jgi:hypothetical protein
MGLGAGSSNAPLQGSTIGTTTPFNAIPYGGGHIPPLSPSLGGTFQHPIRPNANYSLFGGGSLGPSSYTTSVGSMSFSLFGAFGNNTFSLTSFPTGGNPNFGQQNPVQGTIPSQGATTGVYSTQGLWNPLQGLFPSQGMSVKGNPFHTQWNPGKVLYLCREDRLGASPTKVLGTQHREKSLRRLCHPILGVNDDASTDTISFCWSRPQFLPKPWPTVQLFLATWC